MKQEEEKILLIKCIKGNKSKIEAYFEKNHPYDTPEMLWIAPDEINNAYLEWMKKTINAPSEKKLKK